MLRHPPLQLQLLRAMARARGAGGTTPIPSSLAAAEVGARTGGAGREQQQRHQQEHQPSCSSPPHLLLLSHGFASRGPSFLEPQARRAMKQKRHAQQRQRLLREYTFSFLKGAGA